MPFCTATWAHRLEAGEAVAEDELALLFQAGSSPGGARPKVTLHDGKTAWIAKFSSIKDRFDVVRIEAATMALAQQAGLEVPEFKVIELGKRAAFLIRRFDVTQLGRYHQISLQTLLKADGYYTLGYTDISKILRRYVVKPTDCLAKLYLQMVFNAIVGNTDDHLKNFALLHDENGYRLSPAFDLLPNIGHNSEHILRFSLSANPPTRQVLLDMGPSFNLKKAQAETLIDQVAQIVSNWRREFKNYDVPSEDIERLSKDIDSRLQNIIC